MQKHIASTFQILQINVKGIKKPCWNPPDPSSKISISNDDVKGDNPKSLKSYLSWPWHVFSLHVLQFRPFFYPLHSKHGWMSSFGCLSDFRQFFANPSINIIHFSSIRKEENQYVPRFIYLFMLHKVWKHYNNFTFESPMSLHFKPKGGFKSEGRGGFSQLPKMSAKKTFLGFKKWKCWHFLHFQV